MKRIITLLSVFANLSSPAQVLFQKTFGGANSDFASAICETVDGGFILAGNSGSFGTAFSDAYIVKINTSGNLQWTKSFGIANNYFNAAYSIKETVDKGFIVSGYGYSMDSTNRNDIFLCKMDSNGTVSWIKSFEGGYYNSAVLETNKGEFIILTSNNKFGAGGYDVYLLKTDSQGNLLWARTYGGSSEDRGQAIDKTSDGGYIIAGITNSFNVQYGDAYLLKVDSNGLLQWSEAFGRSSIDVAIGVKQTKDQGFILTGFTETYVYGGVDAFLMKTDPNGILKWAYTYGGPNNDGGDCVLQTKDGGFILSGNTSSYGNLNPGYGDVYIVKTDSLGNVVWASTYGGTDNEEGLQITESTDNGFIISGYTNSFGNGQEDVFLVKIDSAGNSGCNQVLANTVATPVTFSVTTPPTQIGSGATLFTPAINSASGSIEYEVCAMAGINETKKDHFNVSPNPSSGIFFVETLSTHSTIKLLVYNVFGSRMSEFSVGSGLPFQLDLTGQPKGIYILELINGNNKTIKKIVLQ